MQIELRKSFVKQFLFTLFLLPILTVAFLFLHTPGEIKSDSMEAIYFFANTRLANVNSGWSFVLAFETSQTFSSGSSITLTFPDNHDGYWCRGAGNLTVIGSTSSPIDAPGTSWNIDYALPGVISGTCIQGSGVGSADRIIISNIDALSQYTTYGVEVFGNIGVLGTYTLASNHLIDINLEQTPGGVVFDNFRFLLQLVTNDKVTITALVLPMPQCNINSDCSYPLEICDSLQQCVPCTSDSQCTGEDICVLGMCEEDISCLVNSDCDFPNEVCPSTLECSPCSTDSECGTGYDCNLGVCYAIPPIECTVNSQCNYPYRICSSVNTCVQCTADSQCNAGDECISGVCTTPVPLECTVNSQCNYPNEVCDQVNECNPCITDWQCNYGHVCVGGLCTDDYECQSNDDCRFPDEVCDNNNVCSSCTYDSQCGEGNFCDTDGVCRAIPPVECTSNSQCDYPNLVCIDESCENCVLNSDCTDVDICLDGDCVPPATLECTVNEHCDYPREICDENNECNKCTDDSQCNVGYECNKNKGVCEIEEKDVIPVTGSTWIKKLFDNILKEIGFNVKEIEEAIAQVEYLAPIATTASLVLTTVVGMSLLNLTFLEAPAIIIRSFLGLLTLLGIRSKGQPYGYVYDAVTKNPESNALVRIFLHEDNDKKRLTRTSVTDSYGVFDAELDPGEYSILVSKNGFGFPSRIVQALSDYPMSNIYRGAHFKTKEQEEIYYSIPIDPKGKNFFKVFAAIIRERFIFLAKFVQLSLLIFGAIFSLILYLNNPVALNLLILSLYVPSILFTIFAYNKADARYGYVYDKGGNALKDVVIGLYDEKEARFVSKRVTDKDGKYRFVAKEGMYRVRLLDENFRATETKQEELKSGKKDKMIVIIGKITIEKKSVEVSQPEASSEVQNPEIPPAEVQA